MSEHRRDSLGDRIDPLGRYERDRASAETAAGHPGAERPGLDTRLDGDVELRCAHLEVVTQRLMRRREPARELVPLAVPQRSYGRSGTGGLGDDMADAA